MPFDDFFMTTREQENERKKEPQIQCHRGWQRSKTTYRKGFLKQTFKSRMDSNQHTCWTERVRQLCKWRILLGLVSRQITWIIAFRAETNIIYPKYCKHWLYTLAFIINCSCLAYFYPKKYILNKNCMVFNVIPWQPNLPKSNKITRFI